jgi:S-DNA-T family DNA segregation ATPase FtsK/SpoIIIE
LASFLLAALMFLALFGVSAPVVNFLGLLAKSLFGWGFYILPFVLLLQCAALLFHRNRPVALRAFAIASFPFFIGSLLFLVTGKHAFDGSAWFDLPGLLARGLSAAISPPGAGIFTAAAMLVLLMIAFRYSIVKMVDNAREKRKRAQKLRREGKPPPPPPAPTPSRLDKTHPAAKRPRDRRDFDIPIFTDKDEPAPPPAPAQEIKPKPLNLPTPAQELLRETPPLPLPQVFAFGKQQYVDPKTGELLNGAPLREAEPPPPDPPPEPERGETEEPPAPSEPPAPPEPPEPPRYVFPPAELLAAPKKLHEQEGEEELRASAQRLLDVLGGFAIGANMINIVRGPSVTRYELELEQGLKLARLTGLTDDIALAMGAESVNISPIPNKMSVVGVELPNRIATTVTLREVLQSREFTQNPSPTAFAIGRDIAGRDIVADIAKMPHLLVAGASGAGKSVCVNSLIVSLVYKAPPQDVKLILIDPKKVEFPLYNGIPQLLVPVITDTEKAANALEWAVIEMERRYALLADSGTRDLENYNQGCQDDPEREKMARIVIIIDEMADLIMESKKDRNMEHFIVRIAQKARACGIHLVLATQRPDAKVITGLIKANVPSRIALRVSDAVNSRIVLDQTGAERLIGHGDMLYSPVGANKPLRVQGCYVHEREINAVVKFVKEHYDVAYAEDVQAQIDKAALPEEAESDGGEEPQGDTDDMLGAAVEVIIESNQGSVSYLQRRLKLGYARAARLMDLMEQRGIVGPFEGSKPRKVLVTRQQWEEMKQ